MDTLKTVYTVLMSDWPANACGFWEEIYWQKVIVRYQLSGIIPCFLGARIWL